MLLNLLFKPDIAANKLSRSSNDYFWVLGVLCFFASNTFDFLTKKHAIAINIPALIILIIIIAIGGMAVFCMIVQKISSKYTAKKPLLLIARAIGWGYTPYVASILFWIVATLVSSMNPQTNALLEADIRDTIFGIWSFSLMAKYFSIIFGISLPRSLGIIILSSILTLAIVFTTGLTCLFLYFQLFRG